MYSYYQKQLYNDRDELDAAIQKGLQQGREEGRGQGREEEKLEIAKAMLADGDSIEKVMKITGLSAAALSALKSFSI